MQITQTPAKVSKRPEAKHSDTGENTETPDAKHSDTVYLTKNLMYFNDQSRGPGYRRNKESQIWYKVIGV